MLDSGIFFVKITYVSFAQRYQDNLLEFDAFWSWLWKQRLPPCVQVHPWRACGDLLVTRDNLPLHRVQVEAPCRLFLNGDEFVYHLLWECPFATLTWQRYGIDLFGFHGTSDDWWICLHESFGHESERLFQVAVFIWLIWYNRNLVVF